VRFGFGIVHRQQYGNARDFQQDVIGIHDIRPKTKGRGSIAPPLTTGDRDFASQHDPGLSQLVQKAHAVMNSKGPAPASDELDRQTNDAFG
jgi:hypothetical protein